MRYEIEYDKRAFDRIPEGLPPQVIASIDEALAELAEHPTQVSRSPVFPYPPRGQLFQHHCDHAGMRHRFGVFFHYSQDETRLLVWRVTYDCQPWPEEPKRPG